MTNTHYFLCTGNSCRSQMADGWEENYCLVIGQLKVLVLKHME